MLKSLTEIPSLPIIELHNLGENYLKAHPVENSWHNNHPYARRLAACSEAENDIEKWQTLFEVYVSLKDGGSLKKQIAEVITKYYEKDPVSAADAFMFQRGISSYDIVDIAAEYLSAHPKPDPGVIGYNAHTNQPQARALLSEARSFTGKKSWIYLYLMHKNKLNGKGKLADKIKERFERNFGGKFSDIVERLELTEYVHPEDIQKVPEDDFNLTLSEEEEKKLYLQRVEQIFKIKMPELSGFEELSIFWRNREPHVRLIFAGIIIALPVASVLLLTGNIYAIFIMAALSGGSTFLVELVGSTAVKVVSMPEEAMELMRSNQEELGLSVLRIKRLLSEMGEQLDERHLQIARQELLLKKSEALTQEQQLQIDALIDSIDEHTRNNAEQKRLLDEYKGQISGHKKLIVQHEEKIEELGAQISVLASVSSQFSALFTKNSEESEQLLKNLKDLTSSNSEIAAQAMANMTEMAKEKEALAANNSELRKQLQEMRQWIMLLKRAVDNSTSVTERQEQVTRVLEQIAKGAGIHMDLVVTEPNSKKNKTGYTMFHSCGDVNRLTTDEIKPKSPECLV